MAMLIPATRLKISLFLPTNPIPLWNANHPSTQQFTGTHLTYTAGTPLSADYSTALGEIYVTGTRNTYRMSIDRQTGDLYMGDVGENTREEVNFLKAGTYNGTQPPVDFGYASREGTTATNSALAVANSSGSTTLQWNLSGGGSVIVNSTNPIREGDHSPTNTTDHPGNARSSYIGGYIYRGPITQLQGAYFYSDFVNSNVFELTNFDRNTPLASYSGTNFNLDPTTQLAALGTRTTVASSSITSLWNTLIFDPKNPNYTPALGAAFGIGRVVSFGEDNSGNLYIVDFGGTRGDNSFNADYPNAGAGQIFELAPLLKGDFTLDNQVTAADVPAMLSALGNLKTFESNSHLNDAQFQYLADVDGDGQVTNLDLQALLNTLKLSSVPEPATLALLAAAGPVLFALRRRIISRARKIATLV